MKPTLVFAMKEEAQDVFDDYDVLFTGVGKVNAAYALAKHIAENKPQMIINLGTAGSRKHAGGTVINPTQFVQRDMDVTALGFEKYQTPFSSDPVIIEYGQRLDMLSTGVCGSGDDFATGDEASHFDCVDMEGHALSLICQRENVPFACLKYISDGADDGADTDWNESLKTAAKALRKALEEAEL
ncbi:MAG: nucleosidase [Alphaproteobacteria bacterium]|nr:nucleosidase [Alphaproteobacteria bacterium]